MDRSWNGRGMELPILVYGVVVPQRECGILNWQRGGFQPCAGLEGTTKRHGPIGRIRVGASQCEGSVGRGVEPKNGAGFEQVIRRNRQPIVPRWTPFVRGSRTNAEVSHPLRPRSRDSSQDRV